MEIEEKWHRSRTDAHFWQYHATKLRLALYVIPMFPLVSFLATSNPDIWSTFRITAIFGTIWLVAYLCLLRARSFTYLEWNQRAFRQRSVFGICHEYQWSELTGLRQSAVGAAYVLTFNGRKPVKVIPHKGRIAYDDYVAAEKFAGRKLKENARTS